MPAKTKSTKRIASGASKRRAAHHKVSKHYLKVYWPYVPMLLVVAIGLMLGTPNQSKTHGVLAYATEVSNTELLTATNKERLNAGKSSLTINQSLTKAAQDKANDMASRNYWSHFTPDGSAPWVFIDSTGYKYSKAGENLAYGFATSKDTVKGWMNSQTHRENMLDGAYSEVGFGFANAANYNNSGKETIVVAMYGQPTGAEPVAASPSAQTNDKAAPYSTVLAQQVEPESRSVSLIAKLTNGGAPWLSFAFGTMTGALLLVLCVRHGLAFKRALVHGEQFFLRHPVLDILIVSFVMLSYVLGQTTGYIR